MPASTLGQKEGPTTRNSWTKWGRDSELRKPPRSIGAFDVSTLFGSESVGALIWWERGEFRKEHYRHVRIKWVEGMDDYSMMYETIVRAFRNLGGNVPAHLLLLTAALASSKLRAGHYRIPASIRTFSAWQKSPTAPFCGRRNC